MSAGLTGEGAILGTLQYMAPEQLEGKEADHRTDIFAFGTTLYEMVTGRKAFKGQSQASLISAIMSGDPPPMSSLQVMSPPALDQIVKTCLVKDPEGRWQTAGDIGRQVQWVTESGSQPSVTLPVATAAPQRARWRRLMPLVAAGLVGGIIIGIAVWSLTRPGLPAPGPLARFVVNTPPNGPLRVSLGQPDVAISPDGTRIVYQSTAGGRQLYLRQLPEIEATPLRGTLGANHPFFSPDGEWVGFYEGRTGLKRVSILGGPPVTICDCDVGLGLRGVSWGPDDTIVFSGVGRTELWRVPMVGGEPEVLTTVDPEQGETSHLWPEVLPNGRAVLFTAWSGSDESSRIAAVSLETGEVTYLVPGGSHPHYSPTGHIVYGVGGTLRAVAFDADRLEVTSNPVPVLEGVNTKGSGAANFALADNGSLVYVTGAGAGGGAQRSLVWVDREGREEPLATPLQAYQSLSVSPDGRQVAFDVFDPAGGDIWIHDLERGTETILTTDPALDYAPLWTPDGEWVVFASDREGQHALFRKLADGSGAAERLVTGASSTPVVIQPTSWSADGQTLLFWVRAGANDVGLISMEGDRATELLLDMEFNEVVPAISPDGGWIAYESNETGQSEVHVQRFPALGGKQTISTDGGRQPLWSPDGHELFYRAPSGMMVVPVLETEPTFRAGNAEMLFDTQYSFSRATRTYDLNPDGQRFLMIKDAALTDDSGTPAQPQIILVQNGSIRVSQRYLGAFQGFSWVI